MTKRSWTFHLQAAFVLAFLHSYSAMYAQTRDLASNVDVFIGTGRSPVDDEGFVMPAAALPFGMLQWGPDPVQGDFYRYRQTDVRGFSLTHVSGVGCGLFGDVPVMPVDGAISSSPAQVPFAYAANYSHADEVASPGFYSVKLDSGVGVELAAALRTGMASFTYPADGKPHSIVIDLSRTQNGAGNRDAQIHITGGDVSGSVRGGGFCSKANSYRLYFALQTEETPNRTCTFDGAEVSNTTAAQNGVHIGACLSFPASVQKVHIRVGLSYINEAAAKANLRAEIRGWNFDKVRVAANATWNHALSQATVSGGTHQQQRVFTTALYHSLLHPSLFSDADNRYLGFDNKIHKLPSGYRQYANFSSWDIYRSQVQLVAMLFPNIAADLAQSLINDAEEGGGYPRWPVANDDSGVMVGDPSDLILANIYEFGIHGFDAKTALALMLRGANDPSVHAKLYAERPWLDEYLTRGYVPETSHSEGSASITLEYANADFAIARFAAALGNTKEAARFSVRAANWRTIFDPDTRYIRARDSSGTFLPDFTPGAGRGFVEGNSAQYTWMVPYDFTGVIAALGGDAVANARLDDYFSQYAHFGGGPYFLISNEPSFSNPWIYNWTGKPWRTQEVVTKVLHDLFTDTPGGIPGNDDVGATSAWALFAQLGMYPAIPGVAGFTFNTPTFAESRMRIGGHTLKVITDGSGPYIASVNLDSTRIEGNWITWQQLKVASTLTFHLSDSHGATPVVERPPSFAPPN